MEQVWADAVFLHWRIPTSEAARFMPAGTVPDEYDGDSWVGLIGFRMRGAGFGRGLPVPYFGTFTEVNVRLYSRDRDGVRGVVFLTLDASRLAVVLGARAAGIGYVWSRCLARQHGGAIGYSVDRFRGASSSFAVVPTGSAAVDPLSIHVTARFGLHSRFAGRTIYISNTHSPWPLQTAVLDHCYDGLVYAAGLVVEGPPESVLYSPGVQTRFGFPYTVT
jgi:uncharacterized protein YqjF (DUF2071 family)